MILSLIVAMSQNRVIGIDNKLPWHLPEDLKRFRKITSGHPVIMGRKTYESIGRLLPQRENIIITRQKDYQVQGATMAHSLESALAKFKNSEEEVFIIGGGEIFTQAWSMANKIYLTLVESEVEGDAYFPDLNWDLFKLVNKENHSEPVAYSFQDYVRN
jgi:dihydrofolate reductase